MAEDFNPFDLTPKKKEEEAPTEAPVKHEKAVVRRVTIGPLLHSRLVKLFVLLACMFFLAFAGYAGAEWWLLR